MTRMGCGAALFACASACACERPAEQVARSQADVARTDVPERLIPAASDLASHHPDAFARLKAWRDKFLNSEEEWVLGAADGDRLQILGRVGKMEAYDERLYVSDLLTESLKVYSYDGEPLAEIAESGGGPREMRGVIASAHADQNTLVVGDPTHIKVFSSASETSEPKATFRLGVGIQDLCIIGTQIFVRTWNRRTNMIIVRVDAQGRDTTFFGAGADFDDENTRNRLSKGPIACVDTPERVAVAFDREPFIHAYHPSGELAWQARIEPFERSDAALGQRPGSEPTQKDLSKLHDGIASFVSLPPDAFLVQVARVQSAPAGARPSYRLASYVIDAETGYSAFLGDDFHPYVRAASSGRFWSVRLHNEGFEQIVSHRFTNPTN